MSRKDKLQSGQEVRLDGMDEESERMPSEFESDSDSKTSFS